MVKKRKKRVNKQITVFTDGSADINKKSAGYGYIVIGTDGGVLEEGKGRVPQANNILAELTATIFGIEAALKYKPAGITVYTDYKTIPVAFEKELERWQGRGWRTTKGKRLKHVEIWKKLKLLAETHHVEFKWVKGHGNSQYNNWCDYLAWTAMREAVAA